MATLYDRKDIVRLIASERGYCVDKNSTYANKYGYFGDLSPACLGFAANDTDLEHVLAIFNSTMSSFRVFNEIHISSGDRNLTIGCGNFANSPMAKLFLAMPMDAWIEFRDYVADLLLAEKTYLNQYAQDYVIKGFLGNRQASELQKRNVLIDSLEYFFARDLLNGQEYSKIEKSPILTSRYKYNGKSWTIKQSAKSYLSLWGDTVMLLAAIDPNTGKPEAQYDVYPDYSDKKTKLACTKFINGVEDKSVSPVCACLFPGHENDNKKCSYWFYCILSKALLIESVAKWQHNLWVKEYYDESKLYLHALNGTSRSILTGLVSWKSNGQTTNSNPPFALANGAKVNNWRNLGDQYYLKSAKEVLVNNKTKDYAARQALIDDCLAREGELFTGLIIWAQFIMTKRKMRSRIRTMWNVYFNDAFKKYKTNPNTTFKSSHIKTASLNVSAQSVILKITDEKTGMVHSYDFMKPSVSNTNNNIIID